MKVEELMIGDWILISPMDCDPVAKRVTAINYNSYRGKDYCDWIDVDGWDELSEREIQLIPLTDDILEKNGFVYREAEETCATEAYHIWDLKGESFSLDDDSWWRKDKDNILRVKFGLCKIEYIHQLQHALRLCGINKEIEL